MQPSAKKQFSIVSENNVFDVKDKVTELTYIKSLPLDTVGEILKPFQQTPHSFFVSLVCKSWKKIMRPYKLHLSQVIGFYAETGSLSALEYLKYLIFLFHSDFFSGNIHTLLQKAFVFMPQKVDKFIFLVGPKIMAIVGTLPQHIVLLMEVA